MPDVNNTESIRDWFRTCPALSKSNRFQVDYLGKNATEYGIHSIPSELKTRKDIIGDEIILDNQEQDFYFYAKLPYGSDIRQNLENLGLFQDVINWIFEKNASKEYPAWDSGEIESITPSVTPSIAQVGTDTAEYRIQFKVNYRYRRK